MNKKNNRKGFTTVELIIVIAVIAILATVLIPTFSNLITKANDSAALQEANSLLKTWMANPDNAKTFTDETVLAIVVDGNVYLFEDNQLSEKALDPKVTNTNTAITLDCGVKFITGLTDNATDAEKAVGYEELTHTEIDALSVCEGTTAKVTFDGHDYTDNNDNDCNTCGRTK